MRPGRRRRPHRRPACRGPAPSGSVVVPAYPMRDGPDGAPLIRGARRAVPGCLDLHRRRRRTDRPRSCSATYVDDLRPQPQARALPVLLDRRRHPAPRRGAGRVQERVPATAASSSTPHGELPDYLPMVLEFAAIVDPDAGASLLQDYRASLELLRLALLDDRQSVRRRRRRGLRDPAGHVAGRPRGGAWRWPATDRPTETVGLEPYDPRLLPLPGGCTMRRAAVGRAALPLVAILVGGTIWRYRYDQFGWTTRSSQLYESRLLRIGSPLFHFGILVVFVGHVGGLVIPKAWTDAVGISRGALPLQRAALRRHRRRLHAGRHRHPGLPAPHHRSGLHGHDQATTS